MENSTENTQASAPAETTGKTVSAKAALDLLLSGKTRAEIKTEMGLTHAQMAILFQTPGLKGRKTPVNKKASVFQVINDIPADQIAAPVAAAETSATNEDAVPQNEDSGSDLANAADLTSNDEEAYQAAATEDIIDASASQEEEEQDDRPPFERFQ